MSDFSEDRIMRLVALYITLMICATRFRLQIGEVASGLALCFGFYLWLKRRKSFHISQESWGYIKVYGVFVLLTIPSILFSDNPLLGIEAFFRMWVLQFTAFIAIVTFIQRREYLVAMLSAFLIFSGFDCFMALIQFLMHLISDNRGWGFGGCLLSIADIMCMLLPIALVILMDEHFEKELKKPAAFAVIGILAGLLSNKSRGAWLTVIVVVPIAVFHYLKQNRKYLIIFVLVMAGTLGFMASTPQYVQRVKSITNTTTDRSNADRIWVLKSAELMIRDYPVTGVGLGQFFDKYKDEYKFEQESQYLPHAHNNFVEIVAETGIVGLIGFLYFIAYYLCTSLRSYWKNKNPYDLLFFITFLIHICVFGQIDYTLWHGAVMQPFMWFLLALLLKLKETDEQFLNSDS